MCSDLDPYPYPKGQGHTRHFTVRVQMTGKNLVAPVKLSEIAQLKVLLKVVILILT